MNAPATIRQSTPLLISETPLQFLPSLAKKLGGANEALMLQQLHFLLTITEKARNTNNYFGGRWWVYNSYEQWQEEHFSWLSISTIKRLFTKLKEEGYVLSKSRKEGRLQLGNWYTINYEKLTKKTVRVSRKPIVQIEQGGVQNKQGTGSKLDSGGVHFEHPFYIAENTTENTYRKNGGGNADSAINNPPPSPSQPAADDSDFISINHAITVFNATLPDPLTGIPDLTRKLINKGVTAAVLATVIKACQAAGNPAGAFINYVKTGYVPRTRATPKPTDSPTSKPKYRPGPNGEIEVWTGTAWGKAYGVGKEVLEQ
jgi:hypothetical protein